MSEEKKQIGLILGESIEDFGHRINVLGLHDETMKRVVIVNIKRLDRVYWLRYLR
jgi:hypothetical protein